MTETKYFTLTRNYENKQVVEHYELLQSLDGLYTVRIVYANGQEEIEQGNLEHFNSKFEITEVKIVNKGYEHERH